MRKPENLFWLPGFDFHHWLNLEEVQRLFLEPILDPLIKSHVTNIRDWGERVLFRLPRIRNGPTEYNRVGLVNFARRTLMGSKSY